jgi:hypothetical protein
MFEAIQPEYERSVKNYGGSGWRDNYPWDHAKNRECQEQRMPRTENDLIKEVC